MKSLTSPQSIYRSDRRENPRVLILFSLPHCSFRSFILLTFISHSFLAHCTTWTLPKKQYIEGELVSCHWQWCLLDAVILTDVSLPAAAIVPMPPWHCLIRGNSEININPLEKTVTHRVFPLEFIVLAWAALSISVFKKMRTGFHFLRKFSLII